MYPLLPPLPALSHPNDDMITKQTTCDAVNPSSCMYVYLHGIIPLVVIVR